MKPIICTSGIIRKDGRILIAQRLPDSKLEALKWEFPGGKIEFTEDPKDCLVREIKEEMDFEVRVGSIFEVSSHNYEKDSEIYHILLLCYLCDYVSGEPRTLDCNDIKWVRKEELRDYDFAAADIPIIEKLTSL